MNQNNKVKVWVVVRQGRIRRTLERVEISDGRSQKLSKIETYTIFPSKRDALEWINRWKNSEDFDLYKTEISLV